MYRLLQKDQTKRSTKQEENCVKVCGKYHTVVDHKGKKCASKKWVPNYEEHGDCECLTEYKCCKNDCKAVSVESCWKNNKKGEVIRFR